MHIEKTNKGKLTSIQLYIYACSYSGVGGNEAYIFILYVKQNDLSMHTHTHTHTQIMGRKIMRYNAVCLESRLERMKRV